eukprot:6211396-Pleurochrysis_carterae.AAC.1
MSPVGIVSTSCAVDAKDALRLDAALWAPAAHELRCERVVSSLTAGFSQSPLFSGRGGFEGLVAPDGELVAEGCSSCCAEHADACCGGSDAGNISGTTSFLGTCREVGLREVVEAAAKGAAHALTCEAPLGSNCRLLSKLCAVCDFRSDAALLSEPPGARFPPKV